MFEKEKRNSREELKKKGDKMKKILMKKILMNIGGIILTAGGCYMILMLSSGEPFWAYILGICLIFMGGGLLLSLK